MDEKQLIQQFISTFSQTYTRGIELRVSSKEVRQFLSDNNSSLSFRAFNRLSACLGCTTGNKYAYSIPVLQGKLAVCVDRAEREFSDSRIMTLNWYGSKRSWKSEWEALYEYVDGTFGCSQVVDVFGGSGFLSLLAARSGYFDSVVLNDSNSRLYNYHLVMKHRGAFKQFTDRLMQLGDVDKGTFELIYADLFGTSDTVAGREGRRQVKRVSISQAVELFVIRHYAYNGQGGWVSGRKSPSSYVEALGRTHSLYQQIEVRHLLYKKVLRELIDSEKTFIVLDPPYLQEVRKQKASYGIEFSIRQHRNLLQLLTKHPVQARVILCGYENSLYQRYFQRSQQEWHCLRILRAGRHGDYEGKEHIWINFEVSELLIEYGEMFNLVY